MNKISISVNDISVVAELNESETAKQIWQKLPFEGSANVWGEEIYFDIPVSIGLADDSQQEVEVGTLAFWPAGNGFCIFFGPTPVSTSDKPRAYSPVNVFGKVIGDAKVFKNVPDGATVRVDKAS